MSSLTTAMVLTAGLGTRLRPLTLARAKPAIPVAGEPMVRRILRWLAVSGVEDAVLNLHHLPHTIAAAVGDGSDLSVRVRYSWEQPLLLGSAGGPRQALDIIGADSFLLVNGDTLTDLDVNALTEAHRASGAQVTLALVANREPQRYGGVRLDRDRSVVGFTHAGSTDRSYHFIGVQAVEAAVFGSLPPSQPAASIGGIYDQMVRLTPGAVRGFVCDATFWDVGTPADYWSMSWAFAESERKLEGVRGERVIVAATAQVSRTILWDDVVVEDRAELRECVVTDGVRVPSGAVYNRTILMPGRDGPRALPLTI